MVKPVSELIAVMERSAKTARAFREWAEALKDAKSQPESQLPPRPAVSITRAPYSPPTRGK